jgi:hypothetical protein
VKKDTVRKTGNIRKRTSAVEIFPYNAMGDKTASNYVSFVFDNRLIVSVDLGKKYRNHRPKVDCENMDTGQVIVPPTRMTEAELVLLLGRMAKRKTL